MIQKITGCFSSVYGEILWIQSLKSVTSMSQLLVGRVSQEKWLPVI